MSVIVTKERPQIRPNSVAANSDETQRYPVARSNAAGLTQR